MLTAIACGQNTGCGRATAPVEDGLAPSMDAPKSQIDGRAKWLRDALLADNRDLLEREDALTRGKFIKMRATAYNYFRGTAAIYYRDMLTPGKLNIPSAYTTKDNAHTLLVGDPHPENYGSFRRANGQMVIDLNDFDGATYGPFYLDVRRLALGFYVMGQMAIDAKLFSPEDRQQLIKAVIAGYTEQILNAKKPIQQSFDPGQGQRQARAVFADLIRRAERDGKIKEELTEYTQINKNGQRTIKLGVVEASTDPLLFRDKIIKPKQPYINGIKNAHQRYTKTLIKNAPTGAPKSPASFKGFGRRLGAGVSSYPVERFYVIIEGPTTANEDDVLLEYKEILNPPALPGLTQLTNRRATNNAQRVVQYQRQLQFADDVDPWLGWINLNPISFRVRERTKYQKGVGVDRILEKLAENEWSKQDIFDYAHDAGRILARAHARAKTIHGKPGQQVIEQALKNKAQAFEKETLDAVNTYGPVTLDDYQRFIGLLEAHGTALGYRPIKPNTPTR